MLRSVVVFVTLLTVRTAARLFYTHEVEWIGETRGDPWSGNRLVAILNHTSLYEVLLAGILPSRFLWQMARHGVVPVASKTIDRPIVGRFWRMVAGNVVSISRERDHTWAAVLAKIGDPRSMVIILPEGRMKRADGLDSYGRPLVVRGGVAELLEAIPDGRFLVAYSLGLHHIQVPGERLLPRLWKPVRLRLESLDLAAYRAEMRRRAGGTDYEPFRTEVIADLTARRDVHCDPTTWGHRSTSAEAAEPAA